MTTPTTPEILELQQLLAGRYSIERELGRGGMGIVLLARDVALDRPVAIKLLPHHLAANPEARERFLQEARTAAGLSHPNIVPIHAVEEHGALVFFVMGYVDGDTLRERVARHGPLSPRMAMKLLQEVSWALGYAHQRGVIHRDVKPDNIMVERATDRAIVTDFGIALGRDAAGDGEVIGTASYMSPEQACGDPVDARSDLYSLGATFFFALTGRPPFQGSTVPAILTRQVAQPAPLMQAVRPEIPGKLATIIDRCLQKAPADRPQTGEELASMVGEARGREFRAPPLVRGFIRNAQVSTMVLLALAIAGQGINVQTGGGTSFAFGLSGVISMMLLVQLGGTARRLLREGYAFADIKAALLAEARVQEEEADVLQQRRWVRRLNGWWYRLWAGPMGWWFFRIAGFGIHPSERRVLPSTEATELVLGKSALAAYEALPDSLRGEVHGVRDVVERLEGRAEALRARGETGPPLTQTVAALENLRLALLRLRAGAAGMNDLTQVLKRAKSIGDYVDRRIEAQQEVGDLLR